MHNEGGIEKVLATWLAEPDHKFYWISVESVNTFSFTAWGDVWEARRLYTLRTPDDSIQHAGRTYFVADKELSFYPTESKKRMRTEDEEEKKAE